MQNRPQYDDDDYSMPMWDDEIASGKKFDLGGRIIERSLEWQLEQKLSLTPSADTAGIRGRVIRTKNVDDFLRCDDMTVEELKALHEKNEQEEREEPV
jgi:hypothetical protein